MRGAASAAAIPTPAFSRSRLRIGGSSLCDLFGSNIACQSAVFRPQNGYGATVFCLLLVPRSATAMVGLPPSYSVDGRSVGRRGDDVKRDRRSDAASCPAILHDAGI